MKNLILLISTFFLLPLLSNAREERLPSLVIECEQEGTFSGVVRDPDTWTYETIYLKGRFNATDLEAISNDLRGISMKFLNCKDAWFAKSGENKPFENKTAIIEDGTFPRSIQIPAEYIVLPKDLKKIIRWQYLNNTKVILPEGIEFIDQYAFEWEILESVNLPQSITHIGAGAFYSSNFETLRLPDNLKIIEDTCIGNVKTKIHLPNDLEEIAYAGVSFSGKSITLPAKLSRIAPKGMNMYNLEEIHSLAPTPPYCDPKFSETDLQGADYKEFLDVDSCLIGVDKTKCILYVPKGSVDLYRNAREWGNFVNIREEADNYAEDMSGFSEWDFVEDAYADVSSLPSIHRDTQDNGIYYYDLTGRRYTEPVKGVNIVISPDGIKKEIHP